MSGKLDARFNELLEMALENARMILQLKLDPSHKAFAQLLARKATVLGSVVQATVRIDQARLRGRQGNKIGEILKAIAEEERQRA